VFIQKSTTGFCIISVYVDDLNIIGHIKDIDEARNHLRTEFEMKDLGRTKLIGYSGVGYLSDPRNARSQIGYIFLHGRTTIFWKSCK
jgi:hypothetical protein